MRVVGAGGRSRGQAIQLGALLLFAILIINLSLFQLFVVPDQNGEIEFKHSEQVRSDMLGARNAVLDAATGDQSFVEVDLAPEYPSRSLFVNPAEPSGTVRTTEARSITIRNDTGGADTDISDDACPGTPETRALEYRTGYNYYDDAPTYRVENTVLFREFPGETLPGSGQQLVTGDTINLLPLRNDFSESGTGSATVEPVPGGVLTTRVVDPEIELPTAYSEPVWEEALSGTVPASAVSVDETTNTLTLSLSGSYALNCGPVGVNGAPPSGARAGSLFGSGGGEGGGGSINPAGFSEVRLVSVSDVGSNSDVRITLKNTDDGAKSLARARIPFYYGGTGGSSARPDYADLNGDSADRLGIRDRFETIDQDIEIGANGGTETIDFEFDENIQDDFFVFKAVYSDGTRATYYIDAPKSTGGTNPTGGTSADQVAYAGSLSGTSNGRLTFDIENTGTTGVTVTEFSISDQSTSDRLEKGNPSDTGSAARELEITGGVTDGFADADNGYTTDGTVYSLDADAVISGGGTATVDLEEFVTSSPTSSVDLSGVQQKSNEASSDITVTLTFSDGSTKEFYFKT